MEREAGYEVEQELAAAGAVRVRHLRQLAQNFQYEAAWGTAAKPELQALPRLRRHLSHRDRRGCS